MGPVSGPALGPTSLLPTLQELQPTASSPAEGQKQRTSLHKPEARIPSSVSILHLDTSLG